MVILIAVATPFPAAMTIIPAVVMVLVVIIAAITVIRRCRSVVIVVIVVIIVVGRTVDWRVRSHVAPVAVNGWPGLAVGALRRVISVVAIIGIVTPAWKMVIVSWIVSTC